MTTPATLEEVIERLNALEARVDAMATPPVVDPPVVPPVDPPVDPPPVDPTVPPVDPLPPEPQEPGEPADPTDPTDPTVPPPVIDGNPGLEESRIPTPFPKVATAGTWTCVAQSRLGWLNGAMIAERAAMPGPNARNWRRFSIDQNAPGGGRAVHQHIDKGDEVNPLRFDSRVFRLPRNARHVLLRFEMYQTGWQGVGGKLLAVMGGRGMAGGSMIHGPSEALGNSGWSNVLMHPGFGGKNALRGYAYAANRAQFGEAEYGITYGRGDVPFPQNKWFTCEVMTELGGREGSGTILQDGVVVARQKGVDWIGKGKVANGVWLRWRFMYGGNPDQLLAPNVVDQWVRNVEIWAHP